MSGDNDLLERATRALRATPPPSDDELASARSRLLAAQRTVPKPNRARTLRWVLPLAAVLAAGSALAATPGAIERVALAVTSMLSAERYASDVPVKRRATKMKNKHPLAAAPTSEPVPAVVPPSEPAVVEPSEPAVAVSAHAVDARDSERARASALEAERRRALRADETRRAREASARATQEANAQSLANAARASTAPVAPSKPAELAADRDLALYKQAHQKHFRARDFAAALRDWDAYLQAFPRGTFAIEAQYNRAICLVRLSRKAEARRALLPFAEGDIARGYRKAEAAKLLKALE